MCSWRVPPYRGVGVNHRVTFRTDPSDEARRLRERTEASWAVHSCGSEDLESTRPTPLEKSPKRSVLSVGCARGRSIATRDRHEKRRRKDIRTPWFSTREPWRRHRSTNSGHGENSAYSHRGQRHHRRRPQDHIQIPRPNSQTLRGQPFRPCDQNRPKILKGPPTCPTCSR